jgi:hypothetical protein
MSLMQKCIRRGRADLALRAAATLLVDAPDRLWRRIGGIAFEDVGGKRVRADLGGEWAVANFIIEAMARANKCRSSDDLLMSVELHPAFAAARQSLTLLTD